jgi:glycerol-3-phosphate dehydrogenase
VRTAKRYWTCAGVRALVRKEGSVSKVSRMHQVSTDAPGLLSVLGGKLTGYRAIAEEVVDSVCRHLGHAGACRSASTPLPGGDSERSGIPHLDAVYGSRAPRVQALAEQEPALERTLAPGQPEMAAEVVYAVRYEWCQRLDDFIRRRSLLGFQPDRGAIAAEAVASIIPIIPTARAGV